MVDGWGGCDCIGIALHTRNPVGDLQLAPGRKELLGRVCDPLVRVAGKRLHGFLDLGVLDLVSRDAWQFMQDVEDLQDDVGVFLPGQERLLECLVAVHPDDAVSDAVAVALLYAIQKPHGNPLVGALAQSGNDFGDAILVKLSRLQVIDIVLILLAGLLSSRLPGGGRVPTIAIGDAEGLHGCMRQVGRVVGLLLSANEARAVGLAAVAGLGVGTIAIDVVVEDELFPRLDVALDEDTHAQLVADDPLVDKAIGVAGVVAEAAEVALFGGVDKLALGQRHKVEVLDALVVVLQHAAAECLLVDDLANVLEDELAGGHVAVGAQAEALFVRLDDGDVGVLLALEALVLALAAARAVADTLHLGGAVDAVRVVATGLVDVEDGVCGVH